MRVGFRKQRGFVLIAMCAAMFLLLAAIGLAFDLGRIYIVRNEGQVFVDAAAMSASSHLNGTAQGLTEARTAVAHLPGHWNMGASTFSNVRVEFSSDGQRFESDPRDPTGVKFARVTVPSNQVDITFLQAIGGPRRFAVAAYAVAEAGPVRLVE